MQLKKSKDIYASYELKILEILGLEQNPGQPQYGPNDAVCVNNNIPYPPVIEDLARLYGLVRERKVTTILEIGSGYSTTIFAEALLENKQEFSEHPEFKALRRNNPFELHTVDCSKEWLNKTLGRLRDDVKDMVNAHVSGTTIGTFNDRICHYYNNLPNITPDFIYLDGPFQHDVKGNIDGTHFQHNDRTVMAGDLLRMEWLFLPGTMIVVDGRTNNARFMKQNFQRDWVYEHDVEGDVHIFELVEKPLGSLNEKQLAFCLGK